jgi:hypothetical protein
MFVLDEIKVYFNCHEDKEQVFLLSEHMLLLGCLGGWM